MEWNELRYLLAFGLACGGAPTRPVEVSRAPVAPAPLAPASAAPAPVARANETDACRGERLAILDAATTSREHKCSNDADCVTVTNPGHPSEEVKIVVHKADAVALQQRADAHLASCGAFLHREAINAFVVVKPECTAGRCVAFETTFHLDP